MTKVQVKEMWLSTKSAGTRETYGYTLAKLGRLSTKLVAPLSGEGEEDYLAVLFRLTPLELSLLVAEAAKGQKAVSLAMNVAMLKGLFRFLEEKGLRPDNPARSLKMPKFPSTLADKVLSHEQVEILLSAAPDASTRFLVKVLYVTGMRVGEVMAFRVKDLVKREAANGPIWTISVWGKSQKTEFIRIPAELGEELVAFTKGKAPTAFVFSKSGVGLYPLKRGYVWEVMKRLGRLIDIPKLSPHWLRHSHASEALRNGANPVIVQRSLRHSNLSTTLKYLHLQPEEAASLFLPPLK